MDSRALTKIQSVALIAIIVVAAVGGGAGYVLWSASQPPREDIRIGICADIDMAGGKLTWRGAVLAAEQVNAEGGILGRNITIVAEDDDSSTQPYDVAVATNALTKLITIDRADFIIAAGGLSTIIMPYQDICSEHKKILFTVGTALDNYTQRVLENYDKYKYYFRSFQTNSTTVSAGMLGDVIIVGNYTGFTKVALLFQDGPAARSAALGLSGALPYYGFQIVYNAFFALGTTDFTSYFAAIEAAGAQIVVPYMTLGQSDASFVKEWHDRQSPTVIWGVLGMATENRFWELTEGKCEYVSFAGLPVTAGYPLTNKTVPTREAYIHRWGEVPASPGAYDTVRFILSDAIKRAGTIETEAVIKTLETTNVETSSARHFVFTSSHDVMVGSGAPNNPEEDYMVMCIFQWQNGTQVPMKPEAIMKEAGATYKYPPWNGPWNHKQTP